MRVFNILASIVGVAAVSLSGLACSGGGGEGAASSDSDLVRAVPPIPTGPIHVGPSLPLIGDANDPATILADAAIFNAMYLGGAPTDQGFPSDDYEIAAIGEDFATTGGATWIYGEETTALTQMYDLVAPLDPVLAEHYLKRLGRIAGVLLANRDDNRNLATHVSRNHPVVVVHAVDAFRNRVMPGWGGVAHDRDDKWNTDVSTSGLCAFAMAAFARRVAASPALQATYGADAIRYITAALQTYEGYRPEMHLLSADPEGYFTVPVTYANLTCANGATECPGYRMTAGKPLAYNESFAMMRALAELAIAADSAMYRNSADGTAWNEYLATFEGPQLIAKSITFFENNLHTLTWNGAPYFSWNKQKPAPSLIQDTQHGGFELGLLETIFEDKPALDAMLARNGASERIPLTASLFQTFANTFLFKIWHYDSSDPHGQNLLDINVDGSSHPTETNNANAQCAGWTALAPFNPWMWVRCRDSELRAPGYLMMNSHAALLRFRQ